MRYSPIIQIILLLLLPVLLFAQEPEVKREREFTGSGLYGYMNGGADQFLEYGVSKLVTRDLVYKGDEFTVDIYDMPTPEDAFGIYSLHIFKCTRADAAGCIDCLSPYQLQAVSGKQYISIVFPSGSEAARSKADELLRLYVKLEGKDNPEIPVEMGMDLPYSGRLKLLRGPLSVSGASLSLSRLTDGVDYTGIWFVGDKPAQAYKAFICLKDEKEVEKIKTKLPVADIIRTGKDYLFMQGREAEKAEEDDHGGFGF